jgi:hypothetical protein
MYDIDNECPIEASFMHEDLMDDDILQNNNIAYDPLFREDDSANGLDNLIYRLPTTNAADQPVYNVVESGVYKSHSTNNHVLLNTFGSCLIRRNKINHGTVNQRNFLQSLVSTHKGKTIPLLYPEAMLFTDQFYKNNTSGSLIGSIPACCLHADNVLKSCGMATLQDHYRSRMSNVGLLASSNPKYHFFAFDSLVNLGLRGCDTRVILRRGFAEYNGKGGVSIRGKKEPIFDTEQVDCRPVVNKLSCAIGEKQPTYFYTHTCSMKTHFGVKLIWNWLQSDDILDNMCDVDDDATDRERLRMDAIESAGVILFRVYMEMIHLWILYITKSPETPLGCVDWFFARMENQEAKGNVPHMHAILWTTDDMDTEHGLQTVLN